MTADDVKFSFDRYRGGAAKLLRAKVKDVRVVDARRVRFVLTEPPALTLIPASPYAAPFEELRLRK